MRDSLAKMFFKVLWGREKARQQSVCTLFQNVLVLGDGARMEILPEDAPMAAPPLAVRHEGDAPFPARPATAQRVNNGIEVALWNAHISTAVDAGREELMTDRFSRRSDATWASLIRRMERPKTCRQTKSPV